MPTNTPTSIGVDGSKGRWLVVELCGQICNAYFFDTITEICDCYSHADIMMIDMPIGLAENLIDIRPEAELRKCLKGKTSSVFNSPCRQAVYVEDYQEASDVNFEILGKRLSRQTFGLFPKIREIDTFLQINPEWKNRLLESHPEFCFAQINSGKAVLSKKREVDGQQERLDLLEKIMPESKKIFSQLMTKNKKFATVKDDLYDAFVLALSGQIALKNGFITVPSNPQFDNKGIKMQIVGARF